MVKGKGELYTKQLIINTLVNSKCWPCRKTFRKTKVTRKNSS